METFRIQGKTDSSGKLERTATVPEQAAARHPDHATIRLSSHCGAIAKLTVQVESGGHTWTGTHDKIKLCPTCVPIVDPCTPDDGDGVALTPDSGAGTQFSMTATLEFTGLPYTDIDGNVYLYFDEEWPKPASDADIRDLLFQFLRNNA